MCNKKNTFNCNGCGEKFTLNRNLKRHMKNRCKNNVSEFIVQDEPQQIYCVNKMKNLYKRINWDQIVTQQIN